MTRAAGSKAQVTIDIRPMGTGCELTLVQAGVLPDHAARTKDGWGTILDALGAVLER